MASNVFFSFNYQDLARAIVVRNRWVSLGNEASGVMDYDDFNDLLRKGDAAIQQWLDDQISGTSVTAVLVGEHTFESPWVKYVISKSKRIGSSILFIDVSKIRDSQGNISNRNSKIPYDSKLYLWNNDNGEENIGQWIEAAASLTAH